MRKLTLRQQVIFGAILVGTATLVSFILGVITAGVPADERATSPWLIGMIFGTVAAIVYAQLSGNRAVAAASDAERDAALAGPVAGRAQLLVVREGFVGKLAGVDILIDGVVRAQLKSPRFASLDLTLGPHEVVAAFQGKTSPPHRLDLTGGGTVVLRLGIAMGNRIDLTPVPDLDDVRRRLRTITMVQV